MTNNPAYLATEVARERTFDEWSKLLDEYWKTLPWKTRFWMHFKYIAPKLYIDWTEFFKWVEQKDKKT